LFVLFLHLPVTYPDPYFEIVNPMLIPPLQLLINRPVCLVLNHIRAGKHQLAPYSASDENCALSLLTILFSPLFATTFPQESNSRQGASA